MPVLVAEDGIVASRLTDREIAELVDRGGKLYRELVPMKKKAEELDQIKAQLRDLAGGKDTAFSGKIYTSTIEQKPETTCRVVAEEDLAWSIKTAGEHLPALFTLHPSKGHEKSFELNALKHLAKRSAQSMIERFTVAATAWVRFS